MLDKWLGVVKPLEQHLTSSHSSLKQIFYQHCDIAYKVYKQPTNRAMAWQWQLVTRGSKISLNKKALRCSRTKIKLCPLPPKLCNMKIVHHWNHPELILDQIRHYWWQFQCCDMSTKPDFWYSTSTEWWMMNWCLMSSDVMRHIRDKLWPMPKHGAINLYVHGNQKAR